MENNENRTISREIIIELIDYVMKLNDKSKRYRFEACIGESCTHDKMRVVVNIVDDVTPVPCEVIFNEMCYKTEEVAEIIDKLREFEEVAVNKS